MLQVYRGRTEHKAHLQPVDTDKVDSNRPRVKSSCATILGDGGFARRKHHVISPQEEGT
jgi:hypothetical protein